MIVNWHYVLPVADDVLFIAGAVLLLSTAAYWTIHLRRDPLAHVPEHTNELVPEGVIIPMLVWLLVTSLITQRSQPLYGGARPDVTQFLRNNAAPLLGGMTCIWVGAKCFNGGATFFLFGDGRLRRPVTLAAAYMLASMALCPLFYHLTLYLVRIVEPNYPLFDHQVIHALRTSQVPLWTIWIGTAIIAPIAEECFFRGMIQTCLQNLIKSRWMTVVLTGALFGAVHAGGADAPQPHVVPALTVLGIMLGVLYMRTGSLLAPILLHVLFNSKTLLWETLLHGQNGSLN